MAASSISITSSSPPPWISKRCTKPSSTPSASLSRHAGLRTRSNLSMNTGSNSTSRPILLHCPFLYPSFSGLGRSISTPCSALGLGSAGQSSSLLRDTGATVVVLIGAYGLFFCFDSMGRRKLIKQSLSRKLVHILSGLLFAMSWPIFSTSTGARFFAASVPLVNCLRLVIHGLSLASDEGLIKSVTREGKPEELLRGPLYYVLILILCVLVFWRESPVGLISLAMMCGGDGVADIMGRKFGSLKLPHNRHKSWAGSISMFFFGFFVSIGMLCYYSALGYLRLDWTPTMQRVACIALVATIVESLPTTEVVDDNISVPLVSIIAAYLTFR